MYHVHEWCGYPFERKKTIKYVNKTFDCGLRYSLEKIKAYSGQYSIRKILTLSDYNEPYVANLSREEYFDDNTEIYKVENSSMDFSGYSFLTKKLISETKNQLVFFTNSSVNAIPADFLDSYVDTFIANKNLGLLGISYSSKIYQSLVKNNYSPHIQSFFFLTSIEVLKEILDANKGFFPGETERYKLSIIRFGEIELSNIVRKLGYDLGVVTEDGKLLVLPDSYYPKILVDGDYRLFAKDPNRINIIKNE
ncbi:hypothetical protein [Sphingobacterium deserti]|uniref:hypothetical protein n=1 Tax=Sphingobacterium deserti TaxID=1229276 RepID=UPI00103C2281|nr:hypothetical protein [Sphingobacterium deserti]